MATVTHFWPQLGLPYSNMTVYSDTPIIVTLEATPKGVTVSTGLYWPFATAVEAIP